MPTNLPPSNAGDHPPPTGDFVDHPNSGPDSLKLGYETTDVNAGGILIFLGGLFGFVIIFFGFCFLMGKVINNELVKEDGPKDKWHTTQGMFAGARNTGGKREDLKSNAAIEQQELQTMTQTFPNPRLDIDDGNQATADLHAREDLLLDHYSSIPGQPGIRIPIDRAMELIAQKGLPVASAAVTSDSNMKGVNKAVVTAPLTSGFARTGFELDTIEARHQKMEFGEAESRQHAQLQPVK